MRSGDMLMLADVGNEKSEKKRSPGRQSLPPHVIKKVIDVLITKVLPAFDDNMTRVAAELKVKPSAVSQWKSGKNKPGPDAARAILLLGGETLEILIGADPTNPPANAIVHLLDHAPTLREEIAIQPGWTLRDLGLLAMSEHSRRYTRPGEGAPPDGWTKIRDMLRAGQFHQDGTERATAEVEAPPHKTFGDIERSRAAKKKKR